MPTVQTPRALLLQAGPTRVCQTNFRMDADLDDSKVVHRRNARHMRTTAANFVRIVLFSRIAQVTAGRLLQICPQQPILCCLTSPRCHCRVTMEPSCVEPTFSETLTRQQSHQGLQLLKLWVAPSPLLDNTQWRTGPTTC